MPPVEEKPAAIEDDISQRLAEKSVDMTAFNQILEMDEPGDNEFSRSIVFGLFDQVEETFAKMDVALANRDLEDLSSLGHFLKGSSATIGLIKVRDGCEKIQRYGKMENLDGTPELDAEVCLSRVQEAIIDVKSDYKDVETALREFYQGKESNPEE